MLARQNPHVGGTKRRQLDHLTRRNTVTKRSHHSLDNRLTGQLMLPIRLTETCRGTAQQLARVGHPHTVTPPTGAFKHTRRSTRVHHKVALVYGGTRLRIGRLQMRASHQPKALAET
jgi:hypothetical protein